MRTESRCNVLEGVHSDSRRREPHSSPDLSRPELTGATISPGMTKTVLFLASEPSIRKVIARTLEAAGFFVLTAGDLGTAMELLKDCTPDLFMVRHLTEDVPGHEAAMYVRASLPGIPVLIVGGILDDPDLEILRSFMDLKFSPSHFRHPNC